MKIIRTLLTEILMAESDLQDLERYRPNHPDLHQSLLVQRDEVVVREERLSCFDYWGYMECTHAKQDCTGSLLAWLANLTKSGTPILEKETEGGDFIYSQDVTQGCIEAQYNMTRWPAGECWLELHPVRGAAFGWVDPGHRGFPCGTGSCGVGIQGDAVPGAHLVAATRVWPGLRCSRGWLPLLGYLFRPILGGLCHCSSRPGLHVARSVGGSASGPLRVLPPAGWWLGGAGGSGLVLRSMPLGLPGEEGAWALETSWEGGCVVALLLAAVQRAGFFVVLPQAKRGAL
ncbi:hypothetical protein NDU88_005628 [Pleurodeles waltl]|uniref:Uncharacterized protein n=1 Tax=Pleurodeles waltl TaxID=8319 RepID=A0AAV7WZA2_PLEWA|nr:hypothetical protein NDU88_005628 [Pleurodeles waltl]